MQLGLGPILVLAMALAMWLGVPVFPVVVAGTLGIVLFSYLVSRNVRILGFALLPLMCVTDKLILKQPIPPADSLSKSLASFLSILYRTQR